MLDFFSGLADGFINLVNSVLNSAGPVIAAGAAVIFAICLFSTGKGK